MANLRRNLFLLLCVLLTAVGVARSFKKTLITIRDCYASPKSVIGGLETYGVVQLDSPAGPGGLTVSLATNNSAALLIPGTVVIPSGSTGVSFPIRTSPVLQYTTVTMTASAGEAPTASSCQSSVELLPNGPQIGAPWPQSGANQFNTSAGVGRRAHGTLKWFDNVCGPCGPTPVVSASGTLYVSSTSGFLEAISGTDGHEIWQFQAGFAPSSPAISQDETVYIGSGNTLRAINGLNGTQRWRYVVPTAITDDPSIGPNGDIYFGGLNGKIYAVTSNGALRWSFQTNRAILSSAAVWTDGSVLATSEDGYLYVLDSATGAELWSYNALAAIESRPVVGPDGAIYFTDVANRLFAISPTTHKPKWAFSAFGNFGSNSPALGPDGSLYATNSDGNLYSLVSSDGHVNWSRNLENPEISRPVLANDGTVYVGTNGSLLSGATITAIDGSTGGGVWQFRSLFAGERFSTCPALGADGSIYLATDNGIYDIAGDAAAAIPNYYQILVTGQSLSVGATGSPPLSTSQPYDNVMLSSSLNNLTPLIETTVETIGSAMANSLAASQPSFAGIVSHNGLSGVCYPGLKQGTPPYEEGLTEVMAAQSICSATGKKYNFAGIAVLHGECDVMDPTYENDLIQWQADYQQDINLITGQTGIVPMFIYQVSAANGEATIPLSPLEQLAASQDDAGKIFMVTPLYIFDYNNMYHLKNTSYRMLGEYYGKVMREVMFQGVNWRPLSPSSIARYGRVITIQFNVPAPPIRFDTSWVVQHANYGFGYSDSSTNPPTITDVSITGPSTVQLTLSAVPSVTGGYVDYAYAAVPGSNQVTGRTSTTGAGGNLRDSDPAPSLYGNHLYNWCAEFHQQIQ